MYLEFTGKPVVCKNQYLSRLPQIKMRTALTYPAMHEQEGTIQLFAAVKCQKMDKMLWQQIAVSYLLALHC